METSENLYFAEPLEPARPKVAANAPAPAVTKPAPRDHPGRHARRGRGPLRRDGRRAAGGCRWIRSGPGRDEGREAQPAPAMAPAAIAARKFEPIEVADELYVGVAYELNRRNDGISSPRSPSPGRSRP